MCVGWMVLTALVVLAFKGVVWDAVFTLAGEATAVVAYGLVGIDADLALGIAPLQHVAYLIPMTGAGWLILLITGVQPRRILAGGSKTS